jgi:hypothetical protein
MDIAVFVLSIVSVLIAVFTLFFVIKGFYESRSERLLLYNQKLEVMGHTFTSKDIVYLRVVNRNLAKKIIFSKAFLKYKGREYEVKIVRGITITDPISGNNFIDTGERTFDIELFNDQINLLSGKKVTLLIKYNDEIVSLPYELQLP